MNYKSVRILVAVFVSTVCLVVAFAFAQDGPANESSPPSHAEIEKSLLTTPKAEAAPQSSQFCRCIDDANSASVEKIKHALHSPLSATGLEFTDTSLNEVLNELQERYAIPIHLDRPALEELGVNIDEPVTVSLRDISLQAALRLMLEQLQLTYIIENEVLLVTSRDAAEKELLTCVYDVRDLAVLASPPLQSKGASACVDCKRLVDVLTNCIANGTWRENGGSAEVRSFGPGLLVVSQTPDVHEKIQNLLSTIRKMKPPEEP